MAASVFVRTPLGTSLYVPVNPCGRLSISELKEFLEQNAGYSASTQRIFDDKGRELRKADSEVAGGDVLFLVLPFTVVYSQN